MEYLKENYVSPFTGFEVPHRLMCASQNLQWIGNASKWQTKQMKYLPSCQESFIYIYVYKENKNSQLNHKTHKLTRHHDWESVKQPTDETKQEIFQVLQLYDAEYGITLCSKYILTDERDIW